MYVDIGDSIALQYGGSEAHKKVTAGKTESNITGPIGKVYFIAQPLSTQMPCLFPAHEIPHLSDFSTKNSLHPFGDTIVTPSQIG